MSVPSGPPSPFHHVQDEKGVWTFLEHAFGGIHISLPPNVSKFMVLELLAAGVILAIYIPICRRAKDGSLPRGYWWNAFESILTFVRREIVRPNMGKHADKYVPFFWTLFLFILVLNLLGMIPFLGSPTASIWVTGGMAVVSFVMFHMAAIATVGPVAYLRSLWPGVEVPVPVLGFLINLLICVLEFLGTFIKSGVLAVRLFANMFAGHLVLAVILGFIWAANFSLMWAAVTTASVVGMVALSLLELFVAFLQAYVFTVLTALFTGMALEHAEHAAHAGHEHHGHAPGHGHAETAHH